MSPGVWSYFPAASGYENVESDSRFGFSFGGDWRRGGVQRLRREAPGRSLRHPRFLHLLRRRPGQ